MKGYYFLIILFVSSFSCLSFADEMDGNPEVAAPAGEIINQSPGFQKGCDRLKQNWKEQYKKVIAQKNNYVAYNKLKVELEGITNNLMRIGCVQSTDSLEQEVKEEEKNKLNTEQSSE